MRRMLAIAALVVGVLAAPSVAYATGNPNGTAQPGQSCQAQPSSPGRASSSPGAPFNEPTPSNPGGTGGAAYSAGNANSPNPKAVSQYDVACYHVSN